MNPNIIQCCAERIFRKIVVNQWNIIHRGEICKDNGEKWGKDVNIHYSVINLIFITVSSTSY